VSELPGEEWGEVCADQAAAVVEVSELYRSEVVFRVFSKIKGEYQMSDALEVFPTKVYRLRGITYVPHYSKPCYVGPGYGVLTAAELARLGLQQNTKEYGSLELLNLGAREETEFLWPGAVKKGAVPVSFRSREVQ
jgi:hypothetical protein